MKVSNITYEEEFQKYKEFYKKDIEDNHSELYEYVDFISKKDSRGKNISYIIVKHKICGESFLRSAAVWKNNKRCPVCSKNRSVSLLHASMCYYGKQLYPESEFEYDAGFRGHHGGISEYDLFIPNYKGSNTLFEFQSRFHDYKTEFDKEKKKFAEDTGYTFIAIDCREISPIEAVFKYYNIKVTDKEIQENFLFNKNYDMKKVQELLDKNLSVKNISQITKISENVIYHNMHSGYLIQKENRKEALYGKCPVIQLTLSGEFIKEFESGWAVFKELGFKVDSCVSGLTRHAHGYLFIKKSDYESGNYIIPKKVRLFNKI